MCLHATRWPALLCMALASQAYAEETSPDYAARLLGDWRGVRSQLFKDGYDWEIGYKLDLVSKVSGSVNRGKLYALDNLDIKLNIDGEQAFGWPDTRAQVYILGNHGGKPALQNDRLPHGLDNIEVPQGYDTIKLYQAWLEKEVGAWSVKAGLYDLNSEFYVNDASALFIHPTYGIGAELAGTGRNGPSIFPVTSLAVRVKWQPDPAWLVQAALLDGVSGDPDNAKGTHIQLNSGDGALEIVEAGWLPGNESKVALGLWRYTARLDDLLDRDSSGNPVQRRSHGGYLIAEESLWRAQDHPERKMRGFFRIGINDGDTTQFSQAWSAGLVWDGMLDARPEDQFGISICQELNSDKWRMASGNGAHHERAWEMSYRGAVTPWLTLQPFAQYLASHVSDPSQDHTWWLGLRLEFNL